MVLKATHHDKSRDVRKTEKNTLCLISRSFLHFDRSIEENCPLRKSLFQEERYFVVA